MCIRDRAWFVDQSKDPVSEANCRKVEKLRIAFNLLAMVSNLLAMASNLVAMASSLIAMASNLRATKASWVYKVSEYRRNCRLEASRLLENRKGEKVKESRACKERSLPKAWVNTNSLHSRSTQQVAWILLPTSRESQEATRHQYALNYPIPSNVGTCLYNVLTVLLP